MWIVRDRSTGIWSSCARVNHYLYLGIVLELCLVTIFVYLPVLQPAFQTANVSLEYWCYSLLFPLFMIPFTELFKSRERKDLRNYVRALEHHTREDENEPLGRREREEEDDVELQSPPASSERSGSRRKMRESLLIEKEKKRDVGMKERIMKCVDAVRRAFKAIVVFLQKSVVH